MTKKITYNRNTYDDPNWSLALGLVSAIAGVAMGMHALDTGSWQQYFMTFALVIFAINRLGHTFIYTLSGKANDSPRA